MSRPFPLPIEVCDALPDDVALLVPVRGEPALLLFKAKKRALEGQMALGFDEEAHPREAAGGQGGKYKPGEFVPKGQGGGSVEEVDAEPDDTAPDPAQDWKDNGVRSRAFKEWFGDWEKDPAKASKIVDWHGEPEETHPVPLYHGTQADFHAFDPERLGESTKHPTAALGFFFSESRLVARSFAGEKFQWGPEKDIRALAREHYGQDYHSIQDQDTRRKIVQMEKEQPKVVRTEKEMPEKGRVLTAYLNLRNPYRMPIEEWNEKFARPMWHKETAAKVPETVRATRERLIAEGYDGIILEKWHGTDNPTNEYSARSYIAFQPEQIKSTENEGTFDPNTSDIRKGL